MPENKHPEVYSDERHQVWALLAAAESAFGDAKGYGCEDIANEISATKNKLARRMNDST